MAQLNNDGTEFNTEEHGEMGFDPVAAGEYICLIENSEMKETKSGTGHYLQMMFEIIDGEFKGRKLFGRYNLVNNSAQAEAIARREFSTLCRAVDVLHPKDSCELHGKTCLVRVAVEQRKDSSEMSNALKGYKPIDGQVRARSVTTKAAGAPKQGGIPWKR